MGYFVVSLGFEEIKQAQKQYPDHHIFYFDETLEGGGSQGRSTITDFIEFWLLGECDEVLTTEYSTYGTNAAARTGRIPIVCHHDRFCFRRLTPQPCPGRPWPVTEMCPNLTEMKGKLNKYYSIENHCGFEEEYAKNCEKYGCPNHHNIDKEWKHPIPPFPPKVCNATT